MQRSDKWKVTDMVSVLGLCCNYGPGRLFAPHCLISIAKFSCHFAVSGYGVGELVTCEPHVTRVLSSDMNCCAVEHGFNTVPLN